MLAGNESASSEFKTLPCVLSRNPINPPTPQHNANPQAKSKAICVTFAHRPLVGLSRLPAMIKAACWHTKANDKTPRPTKMVSEWMIDFVQSKVSHDSRMGAQYKTIRTMMKSNVTLIRDVFAKSATSYFLLMSRNQTTEQAHRLERKNDKKRKATAGRCGFLIHAICVHVAAVSLTL